MKKSFQNKGNVVVEVTMVLPFFIFGMLTFFHMGKAKLAEQIVYEAAVETAEYLAEEAYLEVYNPASPYMRIRQYIDDNELVKKYIQNGIDGIYISGYSEPDEKNQITITVCFKTAITVPFFKELTALRTFEITQQVYVGDKDLTSEDHEQKDVFVFITDNRDVYHTSRDCSHLLLSVHAASMITACENYSPCEFCGKDWQGGVVFITDDGNRYHGSMHCSGLKRTVYRVKKSQVGGLPGCSRCTN